MSEKKKILIVDDEEDLSMIMTGVLEHAGFEVLTAVNGQLGLQMAQEHAPDLIFLDVMMPVIDGYQMCRFLKFDEELKHIPIVIVTARQGAEDKKTALNVGADDVIVKPFDPPDLVAMAKKFL